MIPITGQIVKGFVTEEKMLNNPARDLANSIERWAEKEKVRIVSISYTKGSNDHFAIVLAEQIKYGG